MQAFVCMGFFMLHPLEEEIMNVTLNITTTPATLPAGIIAGLLALSITDTAGNPVNDANGEPIAAQQVSGTSATFPNVAPGDYLASAVRLDSNGSPIGTAVTQGFTVAAPADIGTTAATYDAPQSITVTVA
jgi:hypothetical protein